MSRSALRARFAFCSFHESIFPHPPARRMGAQHSARVAGWAVATFALIPRSSLSRSWPGSILQWGSSPRLSSVWSSPSPAGGPPWCRPLRALVALVAAAAGAVARAGLPAGGGLAGAAGGVWADEAGRADALCVQLGAHGFVNALAILIFLPRSCRTCTGPAQPPGARWRWGSRSSTACRGWASGWHGLRCP